jgi:hypothetical protein
MSSTTLRPELKEMKIMDNNPMHLPERDAGAVLDSIFGGGR